MEIIPDKKIYRLDEQIREAILLLEPEWSKKEIDPEVDLAETVYYGNKDIVMHIWMNILSNAVKFTPEHGKIEVRLTSDKNLAVCRISDSGIGMTDEELKRVFDKFYQADTACKGDGNGLGLTLAARVAKLCGGGIDVSSVPEKGSVFTVTLPL